MLWILNIIKREHNERNGEQVFNFEDLYKLKLKSIVACIKLNSLSPNTHFSSCMSSFLNFYACSDTQR